MLLVNLPLPNLLCNVTYYYSCDCYVNQLTFDAYDKLFVITATIHRYSTLHDILVVPIVTIKVQQLFLVKHKYPYNYWNHNCSL